ncbi:GtrA family protein [Achromobacter aloeverae]|uniref:Polysaccharide biosynthesis protein GtrA n=1 Tax=Achromobacter aloeverae TaxID=1750518 RepID=A0A4Q1HGY9_9BURK|nr:GtrA family protein [Achromobacter aloeverae]RXN86790.1 polysaccharide biosynthesis protein GtrA [Achromobacter aloeverae]
MTPARSAETIVQRRPSASWRARLARFFGVGVLNTLFGYLVYAGLLLLHASPLIALLLGTLCGVIFNYFSIGRLVFRQRGGWANFVRFIVAYAIVYAVNALLLKGLIHYLPLGPFLAQILCIPPSVLTSWVLMNQWVYKNA